MIIAHILTFLVFCYLLPVLLYLFVLATAGRFGRTSPIHRPSG